MLNRSGGWTFVSHSCTPASPHPFSLPLCPCHSPCIDLFLFSSFIVTYTLPLGPSLQHQVSCEGLGACPSGEPSMLQEQRLDLLALTQRPAVFPPF